MKKIRIVATYEYVPNPSDYDNDTGTIEQFMEYDKKGFDSDGLSLEDIASSIKYEWSVVDDGK